MDFPPKYIPPVLDRVFGHGWTEIRPCCRKSIQILVRIGKKKRLLIKSETLLCRKDLNDELLYTVYLDRIASFKMDAPPPKWDGVFQHLSK
jgi:hypothetical protein